MTERERWLLHLGWFVQFNLLFAIPMREPIWFCAKAERRAA